MGCVKKNSKQIKKNYRDIKNTTYEPPNHKEPTKIKNTVKNIETKIQRKKIEENEPMEIKIEKIEPLEIRNTIMKVETKINEVPEKKKKKKKKKIPPGLPPLL